MIRILFSLFLICAALPAKAIDIQEVTSPGGITAWLVQEPSIPMIGFDINFKGGANLDPASAQGATYMMMGLLEEGAGDLDATAFRKATEALAANFSYNARRDTVSISAEVLRENAEVALDLLRLAIVEPQFNDVAIKRVKGQVLSGLRSDATDPDVQAGTAFRKAIYGDHAYGLRIEGTIDSVTDMTRAELVAAHQSALRRDGMSIGVVGDISPAELGPLLDRLLADLPSDGPTATPAPKVLTDGSVTVVEMPVPQSVVVFGHKGIERDHDDFFAAYVMNHILGGGGFSSRLTQSIRVERGLTYGIYSYLAPSDLSALYMGGFATANNRVGEAISVLRDEWTRMRDGDISQEELDNAKRYLTGAYPLRFDSNVKIAGILAGLQTEDLSIEYVNFRNDRIDAISLADVKRVARDLLKPELLNLVVVGQPEGL